MLHGVLPSLHEATREGALYYETACIESRKLLHLPLFFANLEWRKMMNCINGKEMQSNDVNQSERGGER